MLPQVKALERNLAFIGEHTVRFVYYTMLQERIVILKTNCM